MLGGTISGRARFAPDGAGYGAVVDLAGVSLSEILAKAFGYAGRDLSGSVSGHAEVICRSPNPRDFVGSLDANVTNGTLWEVPMVLALMNVMNLKLPERTLFDSAHIRCKAAGNRLIVDEISMSSDPATIVGNGVIDLGGTLDLTFYSRPGRIPVVSIIAGEVGKQILQVHMTGTFAEPKVTLVPSGPVGRVLDWVKRRFEK